MQPAPGAVMESLMFLDSATIAAQTLEASYAVAGAGYQLRIDSAIIAGCPSRGKRACCRAAFYLEMRLSASSINREMLLLAFFNVSSV
jgi:hypothetical protein